MRLEGIGLFFILFFLSFMTTCVNYLLWCIFFIVTEFTTALPCVPRDRKPVDNRWARAALWDGTVAVQDKLYTCQSDSWYNTGTIHLSTILCHSGRKIFRCSNFGRLISGHFYLTFDKFREKNQTPYRNVILHLRNMFWTESTSVKLIVLRYFQGFTDTAKRK